MPRVSANPSIIAASQQLIQSSTTTQGLRLQPFWLVPPQVGFTKKDAADADENQIWTPYPFKSPSYRSTRYATLFARGNLVRISNEVTSLTIGCASKTITSEMWRTGDALYNRLLAWRADLEDNLEIEQNRSPPTLCLQYDTFLLPFSRPFTCMLPYYNDRLVMYSLTNPPNTFNSERLLRTNPPLMGSAACRTISLSCTSVKYSAR